MPTPGVRPLMAIWLLRWGLPGLAAGLGAVFATLAGLLLACGCGAGGRMAAGLMMAGGLYFMAAGAVAVISRLRGQLAVAHRAALALMVGVAVIALGQSLHELYTLQGPRREISSQLLNMTSQGSARYGPEVEFTLADNNALNWSCGTAADCWSRKKELDALRWELPLDARFVAAGDILLGLNVDGVWLIDPEREAPRRANKLLRNTILWTFGGLLSAIAANAHWRRTRTPHVRESRPLALRRGRLRP